MTIKILNSIVFLLVLMIYASQALAATQTAKANVILLMVDGVRWQEFFNGTDNNLTHAPAQTIFSQFWSHLAEGSLIFGNKDRSKPFLVSNLSNTSLPAYRSIFTGRYEFLCWDNTCGQVTKETLQERLLRELRLKKTAVATISSWQKIELAVESHVGSTVVNTGLKPFNYSGADAQVREINEAQNKDVPSWPIARYDRYTFSHSMLYLKKFRPRFMFISLNDADEWGHLNNYPAYLNTLKQYDAWILELVGTLKSMADYGENTTLLIMTDHGRGDGGHWVTHSPQLPESRFAWLVIKDLKAPFLTETLPPKYSHIDVRPTIESLFGLKPLSCLTCGRAIKNVVHSK